MTLQKGFIWLWVGPNWGSYLNDNEPSDSTKYVEFLDLLSKY
jgi:hypothetical protein